jgi:hypothetical protein
MIRLNLGEKSGSFARLSRAVVGNMDSRELLAALKRVPKTSFAVLYEWCY